jgi:tubulin alpha
LFVLSSDDRSLTGLLTRSFPRIHFPLATLSPIVPVDRVQHEMNDVANITAACFQRGSQMINCDPVEGKYSTPFLLDLRQL